ncbi:MAG: STAS domain-containing protein [Spirochaetes bacterium]|nr:STAS domain-containing protein [Spirochaetota bacterium]
MIEEIDIKLIEINSKRAVISIGGYINTDTSEELAEKIKAIRDEYNSINFIFNIKKVKYISSAGVEVFMNIIKRNKNGKICFLAMNDNARRVFELVGFLNYFGDARSIEEAEKFISN